MAKLLNFLIWPAGMAIIFGVAWLLARRAAARPAGPRLGRLPWLGYRAALDDADGLSRSSPPSGRPQCSSASSSSGPS